METFKEQNEKINKTYFNVSTTVDRCLEAHRTCLSCVQHCLSLGGKHADYRHITLMLECSDMARLTADFIESTSDYAREVADLCARISSACAESCHRVDPEDTHMSDCALVCNACAEACHNLEF